jgi:hypothetical protein
MDVLSKLQFVAIGLLHEAKLFTDEDLAHLSHCSVNVYQADGFDDDTHSLEAIMNVHFKDWSYSKHKADTTAHGTMSATVNFSFEQDKDLKLTGKVRGGFYADDDVLVRELQYIKGW